MMSAGNRPSHIKTVWRGWQRPGERAGRGVAARAGLAPVAKAGKAASGTWEQSPAKGFPLFLSRFKPKTVDRSGTRRTVGSFPPPPPLFFLPRRTTRLQISVSFDAELLVDR